MINVFDIKPGERLSLRGGIVAKVVENMDDGMWLQVEYLEVPGDEAQVGTVELCHAQDIVKLIATPQA